MKVSKHYNNGKKREKVVKVQVYVTLHDDPPLLLHLADLEFHFCKCLWLMSPQLVSQWSLLLLVRGQSLLLLQYRWQSLLLRRTLR